MDVDPTQATPARPGSEEKLRMLSARFAAGLALWNTGDRHHQGLNEGELIEAIRDLEAQL
jgi:hypothetical protein